MRILLRLAEDLCHLVVYELYEQHNHPVEPKDTTKTPRQQTFRLARTNPSRYTLSKIEEGENGQLLETESESPCIKSKNLFTESVSDIYMIYTWVRCMLRKYSAID